MSAHANYDSAFTDGKIALDVTFRSGGHISRIQQHRPLVIELVIYTASASEYFHIKVQTRTHPDSA